MLPRDACKEAVEWASQFETLQQAWDACERGDWMLWLIGKKTTSEPWSDERKPFLACALDCAELVNHLWSDKIKENVLILRKWISGTASAEEAKEAHHNLWTNATAAAYAAYATAAAYAAYAAAAYAAAAYAAAAYAADAHVNRQRMLKQCAEIVRRHFPKTPRS